MELAIISVLATVCVFLAALFLLERRRRRYFQSEFHSLLNTRTEDLYLRYVDRMFLKDLEGVDEH